MMSDPIVITISNYIDGKFVPLDAHIKSYNPATGLVNALIPDSDENQVSLAVDAAKKAFQGWSKTSIAERVKYLNRIADLIEANASELALLESNDQGKPLWLAQTVDIPRAVLNFRHFALAVQNEIEMSTSTPEPSGILNYTIHEPVGVVGVITPWNLPLYLLSFKLAPAIAYGNTVVAKPSELTSVTAFKLCQLIEQAGLPSGVINMVFGYGKSVGSSIISHKDVKLVSFTGGTSTGKQISIIGAPMFKKMSLELGGKNAAVVFNDVDLDKSLPQIIRSSFLNQGEICLASSRIYVQKGLFETFVERFTQEVMKLKVGDPLSESTFIGALISKEHLEKVQSYIDLAIKEGDKVVSSKLELTKENSNGFFCPPTVITSISDESRCMKEEIFGPVVCIVPFDSENEVISRVNSSEYGLCASVWSSNVDTIHRVAHQLKAGTVWLNCWLVRNLHMPFGGMKNSGTGREGTFDSREFYTEKKTVCLKIN